MTSFVALLLLSLCVHLAHSAIPSSKIINVSVINSRDNGKRVLDFVPEGIAYVPHPPKILLSSLAFGTINSVDLQSDSAKSLVLGAPEGGNDPGLRQSVGLSYDKFRKLLFTVSTDPGPLRGGVPPFDVNNVTVVDIFGNKSVSVNVPGALLLNDLDVSLKSGRVYVTDLLGFKLYKAEIKRRYGYYGRRRLPRKQDVSVEIFSDDDILRNRSGIGGPNGIIVYPNERFLITATSEASLSRFIKFVIGRGGRARGKPRSLPLFDLKGDSLDGKINITGYDGIVFWGSRRRPTEILAVNSRVVLRFASYDGFRSLTLVEEIDVDIPECLSAATGARGPNNKLFVVCTTFGQPGENSVLTIRIQPIGRSLRRRIKYMEFRRLRMKRRNVLSYKSWRFFHGKE